MLAFQIARRQLVSRKSHTVVNIISIVSVIAMAVPVMAMVVILSLHNGLGGFIENMYSSFDSQLRITPTTGQTFRYDRDIVNRLTNQVDGVEHVSATLEQNVLLTYGDRQSIATIRGVDSLYSRVVPIAEKMVHGEFALTFGGADSVATPQAVLGQGVAYTLGVNPLLYDPLTVYSIRLGSRSPSFIPLGIYNSATIQPSSIYALDQQTDSRYIFAPLSFVQSLLESTERISSLEMSLSADADPERVRTQVQTIMGDEFRIQNRMEQRGTLYRMITQEKWIIYLLLLFVFVIAALSLVGSVVMLITDKAPSNAILESLGASRSLLQQVFTIQGVIITLIAVVVGTLSGIALSLLQQYTGILKMAGGAFLTESYPVEIHTTDIILIAAGVALIGSTISLLTTISLIKKR